MLLNVDGQNTVCKHNDSNDELFYQEITYNHIDIVLCVHLNICTLKKNKKKQYSLHDLDHHNADTHNAMYRYVYLYAGLHNNKYEYEYEFSSFKPKNT